MSKAYTVGRGSTADIKIPKKYDTVGKLHLEIAETGGGQARITDLHSTNGTYVCIGRNWEELKGSRTVSLDMEMMLGDFRTTPAKLLATAAAPAPVKAKTERRPSEPPPLPVKKKRSGPRRNEFGEIVLE
jgi:hypothetical protein